MNRPDSPPDIVRVAEAISAIAGALGPSPDSARRAAILHRLDRLVVRVLGLPTNGKGGGFLERFGGWLHELDDEALKARLAAVLSRGARQTDRPALADRLRIRALNYADRIEDPEERAERLIEIVELLADVDRDESLLDSALQLHGVIGGLDPEQRRPLAIALSRALARLGAPEEAAEELQSTLAPEPDVAAKAPEPEPFELEAEGGAAEERARPRPVIETPQGRFKDPAAGLVFPKHRRRRR